MILRLDTPVIEKAVQGGRVVEWFVAEGESVSFGETVCRLGLDEFAAMRRTARATLLSGRKRNKLKSDVEVRSGKVYFEVDVVSSDNGTLRKVVAQPGDQIVAGDMLAVITNEADDQLGQEEEWRAAPPFRVIVNVVGAERDL